MKKIVCAALAAVLCFGLFTGCGSKRNKDFVAQDAVDLIQEDYGFVIKKGNTTLQNAVNAKLNELKADGELNAIVDYFTALDDYSKNPGEVTKPEAKYEIDTSDNKAGTLKVYTESGFAPFEFMYEGKVVGVDMAIMAMVAEDLDMKLEINDVAFDNIVTEVKMGNEYCVGAAGITITDDRKLEVDFSDIYYSTTLVLVAPKDKNYTKLGDLKNLKIGVQEGTTGDLVASEAVKAAGYSYDVENDDGTTTTVTVKAEGCQVVQYKQYALVYQDLKLGKVDCILMDKLPAESLLKTAK